MGCGIWAGYFEEVGKNQWCQRVGDGVKLAEQLLAQRGVLLHRDCTYPQQPIYARTPALLTPEPLAKRTDTELDEIRL